MADIRTDRPPMGPRRRSLSAASAALVATALVISSMTPAAGAPDEEPDQPRTVRASISSTGVQGNGAISESSISADGRFVVFSGNARNLVPNAPIQGAYRYDTVTGTTTLVSASDAGVGGNSSSGDPTVSADGRYVAFRSLSSNLVADDTNGQQDVFVRDMDSGTIALISRDSSGNPAAGRSDNPRISADGRFVVFSSAAPGIVDGVTGGQVYLHEVSSGTTTLVSASSSGVAGNGTSGADRSDISADGRYVAFLSQSTNLTTDPVSGAPLVFVRDTVANNTRLITFDESYNINNPSISPDGSLVAWDNGFTLRIRPRSGTAKTEPVGQPSSDKYGSAFSADNRFVVQYEATTADGGGIRPWLYDLDSRTRLEVARATDGSVANAGAVSAQSPPGISGDGRFVAYVSGATNLVADDTNGVNDAFVHDIGDLLGPVITDLRVIPETPVYPRQVTITATATDVGRGSRVVTSVESQFDSGAWSPAEPSDGSFDSASENVAVTLGTPEAGSHEVCLRATDNRGNRGPATCTSFDYERPGFEQDVIVTIRGIRTLSDTHIDLDGNSPDFYARVLVSDLIVPVDLPDNRRGTVEDTASIEPDWEYPFTLTDAATAVVMVEVWDSDGFLAGDDDLVDINPDPGVSRLTFQVDLQTGTRTDGQPMAVCTDGDDPEYRAKLCISVDIPGTDVDRDGIPNAWELGGIDIDRDGTLELDLPALGADPCRPTIITEIDYMDGSISWPSKGWTHEPSPDMIPLVAAAYDRAPFDAVIDCPFAGFPTKAGGINFVGYVDEEVPEQAVDFDVLNSTDADEEKNGQGALAAVRADHFDERMLPWVHYGLYIHAKFVDPADGSAAGTCCDRGSYQVSFGTGLAKPTVGTGWVPFFSPEADPTRRAQREASTVMHEIGHALGLGHGGDSNKPNYRPNHMSIMNYAFNSGLITRDGDWLIDYSREKLPTLDESALVEGALKADTITPDLLTSWRDSTNTRRSGPLADPIDWNGNGSIEQGTVAVDVNGDGVCVAGNNVLTTTPSGDDVIVTDQRSKEFVVAGANGKCETTAAPDGNDEQLLPATNAVVDIRTIDGHDDWARVRLRGAQSMYGNALHPVEDSLAVEPTIAELEENDRFWQDVITSLTTSNEPPVITGTEPATVPATSSAGWEGTSDELAAAAGVSASDPDSDVAVSLSSDARSLLPVGETLVTWTATDGESATTTATQVITVSRYGGGTDPGAGTGTGGTDGTGTGSGSGDGGGGSVGGSPGTSESEGGTTDRDAGRPQCTITGTPGDDVLVGTHGDDVICGLGGRDRLIGRSGADVLIGGSGADVLIGGPGEDELRGWRGADRLRGGPGDDRLIGGPGEDELRGARGADRLRGGRGRDLLFGGSGSDDLRGQRGMDQLLGGTGDDQLLGGRGDDLLRGWRGADLLRGGSGNDRLVGGPGRDRLFGGSGANILID